MKYRDLQIQTQRETPNNARTQGFAFLVRAGYLTRENVPTQLGKYELNHLKQLFNDPSVLEIARLPILGNDAETFFPIPTGDVEVAHCPNCKYTERLELATFKKTAFPQEEQLPLEKVSTPDCNTIEALAIFLNVPKVQTAKALMYTRISDGRFVFVVVRGDMQMSEAKLKAQVGDIRLASPEEIVSAGAAPGYASAIGLSKEALVVVDDLIPLSQNLVAGANEAGYHLKNTNYGRDYSVEVVADLVQAQAGDACVNCGNLLSVLSAIVLAKNGEYDFENILLALAETHHNDKGLTLPHPAAPFDVYLMHVPGKDAHSADTRAKAEELYNELQAAGVAVLFDDRDERAGVKFNDADLIGCPLRVTVGEKALKDGMVELKPRKVKENQLVPVDKILHQIHSALGHATTNR